MIKQLRYLCTLLLLAVASVAWADTEVAYDFSEISDFSSWTTSYSKHEVAYDEATVTFASANRQTSTITDIPVTKGGDVTLVLNEDYSDYAITSVTFNCTQWGSKAQTITLHYSADGGTTYTSTGVTSTNFTISSSSLPAGTNAVKITFSNSSNQVGIASVSFTYAENTSTAVTTTTTIDYSNITNTDIYNGTEAGSLSAIVKDNNDNTIEGATVTWTSDNEAVATINENGVVTLVAAGSATITASYAGVENTYKPSSDTYELTVVDNTPFTGGDVTFICGTDKTSETSLTKDGVTMSFSESGDGTWDRTDNYRLYANKSFTISTETGTITKIAFTISQNNFSGDGYDSSTKEWTGNATSVTFAADGGQVRFTPVVVTVDLNGTADPSFTISNNEEIAYNATSGSFNFTVDNPVNGGVTSVSENVDWISDAAISGNSVSFTTTANNAAASRSGVITLTYTYGTNNETVTKEVTVTQAGNPNITNIPDLFAAANSTAATVSVTFNNWVVSGVSTNGKNVFVTDNNGNGFVIYSSSDQSGTYAVGNILSGTVSCSLKKNTGYAQLTDVSGLTINTGGSVTEANIDMANLAGVNTGTLVSYENLTCSVDDSGNTPKYYLSDGTTTLQVYTSLYNFTTNSELEDGKTYNITGIYQQYNNTKEILPRSADDIVLVEEVGEDPGFAFIPAELTITQGEDYEAPEFDDPEGLTDDVVFTTTNESVASWDATEGLVLGGATGTATITATFEGDDTYKAGTATLTVTVIENLNFEVIEGCGIYQKITSADELEVGKRYLMVGYKSSAETYYAYNGFDQEDTNKKYGIVTEVTVENNRINNNNDSPATPVVLQKSGNDWFIMDGDNFLAYTLPTGTTKNNNLFSVSDATTNGTLWTIDFESENGYLITNVYNNERNLAFNSDRFACYLMTQQDVVLYKELTDMPITVKAGFPGTTFSCNRDLDFTEVEGVKAYIITDAEGTTVEVNKVPANTGLYLEVTTTDDEAAQEFSVPVITEDPTAATEFDDVADNLLIATDGTAVQSDSETTYYAYGKQNGKYAFFKVSATKPYTPSANKALLAIPTAQAKDFILVNGGATGINAIEAQQTENGTIYNLAGQRVAKAQKGIYIVNGHKVVIR